MTTIQATGLHPEMLWTFFLSRYWKERSVVERMSAAPGASSPFDFYTKGFRAEFFIMSEICPLSYIQRSPNKPDRPTLFSSFVYFQL